MEYKNKKSTLYNNVLLKKTNLTYSTTNFDVVVTPFEVALTK